VLSLFLLVLHGDRFDGVIACAKWLAHMGDWAYGVALRWNDLLFQVRKQLGLPYWSLSAWLKHKVKNAVEYISRYEECVAAEARKRGVDGVVFCADSQYEKMAENVESFQNLEENLRSLKQNLAEIPYVLQYNKRDLPNVAPVEYMEFLLNNREVQVPSFTAAAHKCEGVFETLNMITRMLLNKYIAQSSPQYA